MRQYDRKVTEKNTDVDIGVWCIWSLSIPSNIKVNQQGPAQKATQQKTKIMQNTSSSRQGMAID